MHATGNPATLEHLKRDRSAPRILILRTNMLLALDIVVGLLSAYFCGRLYLLMNHAAWAGYDLISPLFREALLCSMTVALAFGQPRLSGGASLARWRGPIEELLARGVAVLGVLIALEFMTHRSDQAIRLWLLIWSASLLAWFCSSRVIFILHYERLAAVVGAPDVTGHLASRLVSEAEAVAVLDDDLMDLDCEEAASSSMSELFELTRDTTIDTIVVTLDCATPLAAQPAIRHLGSIPARVTICRDVTGALTSRRLMRAIKDVPIALPADSPLRYWELLFKSIIDLVGAVFLLCVLSPIAVIVSVAIAMDSPGPIIFRQQRSGWCGRLFTI